MPTYRQYCEHAKSKGFQPMSETAFNACVKSGFNPITNEWIK